MKTSLDEKNIKNNKYMDKLNLSILIFIVGFCILRFVKPPLIFDKDGSLREFGIGYRNKTVVPMWLAVLIIAIFSYLGALSYQLYYSSS